jgi:Heavy-metal resistance
MTFTLKSIAFCAVFMPAISAFSQHTDHQHSAATHAPTASAYAGEQTRSIKALSASETKGWLEGQGMGLARAAELNGYPGPMHVLELRRPLRLSDAQMQATEELMQKHKAEVRRLGAELVDAERRLDSAFVNKSITPEALAALTRRIGELQAQIRDSHLQTHLKQTALLNEEQIASYASLRGYMK